MTHYIALIHKETDSCYGVSFPDIPGVIAAADSLETALEKGAEALTLAAEDWDAHAGSPFPEPRNLDDLRNDCEVAKEMETGAVVAAIPFRAPEKAVA